MLAKAVTFNFKYLLNRVRDSLPIVHYAIKLGQHRYEF